jgi:hypothetical protein
MLAIAPLRVGTNGSFIKPPSSITSRYVTSRRDYLSRVDELNPKLLLESVQPETTDAIRAWRLALEHNTSSECDGCDIVALRCKITGKLAFVALEPCCEMGI